MALGCVPGLFWVREPGAGEQLIDWGLLLGSMVFLKNVKYFSLYFFFFLALFIYFWRSWVFVALCGLSVVAASGGYSSLRYTGFSLRWLLLFRSMGSRRASFSSCGSRALERRLSSCGTRAQLLCGMWDLPGPGIEPVSPALAGGFLTTAPPGKPGSMVLDVNILVYLVLGTVEFVEITTWSPSSRNIISIYR